MMMAIMSFRIHRKKSRGEFVGAGKEVNSSQTFRRRKKNLLMVVGPRGVKSGVRNTERLSFYRLADRS